jgi:type VI secretion system protein
MRVLSIPERTLLERLGSRNPVQALTARENPEEIARSILRHLRNMLNTRQGHVLTQPLYGMPDMTEFVQTFPDTVASMQTAIRQSIERFEPRLRNVAVRYVPGDDWPAVQFKITAELQEADETAVWFQTTVAPSGRVEVRE